MQAEQVAKIIKEEFSVICVSCNDYYMWNAPYGVYGAEFRDIKRSIEARIEELEQQEEDED